MPFWGLVYSHVRGRKLESTNIVEYEVAARLAFISGHHQYIDEFLKFAEIEWDHELYFRQKSETHFVYKYSPKWVIPKPKQKIKDDMGRFRETRLKII